MKSTIRFNIKKSGSWTLLTLPKNISAKLPSHGKTMVEGTINGLPFKTALTQGSNGNHTLKMNTAMQGDALVEITRVGEESETRVPSDLHSILQTTPRAFLVWKDITPIARRDWIFWIISAKLPETRKRRIEKARTNLSSGKRRVCCFGGIQWLMKA